VVLTENEKFSMEEIDNAGINSKKMVANSKTVYYLFDYW